MMVTLFGGIGLFLLGMTLMTDGLKALAGGALRRVLTRHIRGPVSGFLWGTGVTALVQSSTATTMTTIGFVSAGLLTFPRALGVIFGANLGATSTGWIVALLGLQLSVGKAALPLVFGGAMMRLLGRERAAAAGLALAGFGLLFLGIDTLQLGMAGLAEQLQPEDLPGATWAGRVMLVGIGFVMTVIMQSSSAAVATTLVALSAGSISLDQAAAMVIGQNVGSAVTTAIASIGASVPAKRTAVAHILFNVITALAAFAILPTLTRVIGLAADLVPGDPGAMQLAAFHTAFNVLGVLMLLPLVRPFAELATRLVRDRGPALTRHLDRTVAQTGPIALEAARRTVMDIAAVAAESARGLIDGQRPRRRVLEPVDSAEEALRETRRFVAKLGEAQQSADERRRHLSTLHAVDHISLLLEACREPEPPAIVAAEPALKEVAHGADGALETAERWLKEGGPSPIESLRATSQAIARRRRAERARTLERTAAGELDPDQALSQIETLRWLDRLGYHAWRAAHHLQDPPPVDTVEATEPFSDSPSKRIAVPAAEAPEPEHVSKPS